MALTTAEPSPREIRQARVDNPKLRERDLACKLGITEADYVAAYCGLSATRIEPRVKDVLEGLGAVGEVMALTRNESAVQEKIGVYENVSAGPSNALVLGSEIDLRIFPKNWVHGFAVEKRDGDDVRRSLQFFDRHGDAVHKVHLRPSSNLYAYSALVESLMALDQRQTLETVPAKTVAAAAPAIGRSDVEVLRSRWMGMSDVHDFARLLRELGLSRHQAVRLAGDDLAWPVDGDAVSAMMALSVSEAIPIMCFVGSSGCIQIHSGPIHEVKPMGPWLNVMDPTFHLHLRVDHIQEIWAVRKPVKEGHVTSLEAYDGNGRLIIQFFGKRHEGNVEREDWRMVVENLPRLPQSSAA